MNRFIFCLAILGTFLAGPIPAQEKDGDAKRFPGTWKVISAEFQGRKQRGGVGHRLVFDKKELSFQNEKGKTIGPKGRYRLNTSKAPKEIDIVQTAGKAPDGKAKVSLGIYEFKEKRLRLCYAAPGKPRPTDFKTKPGDGRLLVVLERVEQKK